MLLLMNGCVFCFINQIVTTGRFDDQSQRLWRTKCFDMLLYYAIRITVARERT